MPGLDIKSVVVGLVLTIIGTIIVFLILGATAPDITAAADNISNSGLPLASLYSSDGVVLLTFMAGVLITMVVAYLKGAKG